MIKRAIKNMLWAMYGAALHVMPKRNKYDIELAYWKSRYKAEGQEFRNAHFNRLMLAMADEKSDDFVDGKVIADLGCGPRGSLAWATSAKVRIGIDVLAARYSDYFERSMKAHGMVYVTSTEKVIPLPSDYVDIVFTINAMDHMSDFAAMSKEIARILKPGGVFIGSINLSGVPSPNEPQRLTEDIVKDKLLKYFKVLSYRLGNYTLGFHDYTPFLTNELHYQDNKFGVLWVKAVKPG